MEAVLRKISGLSLWVFVALASLSVAAQNIVWVGFACWVLLIALKKETGPEPHAWAWLWMAACAWALLASFRGLDQAHSLHTWTKLLLFVLALYVAAAVKARGQMEGLIGTFVFFMALWCLAASVGTLAKPLAGFFHGQPCAQILDQWKVDAGWRARLGSGGYMVMATTAMGALCFTAGLAARDRSWRKILPLSCLATIAFGLLLTLTRGAWLGALAGLVLVGLATRPTWVAVTLVLAAMLHFLVPQNIVSDRFASIVDIETNASNQERLYMWRAGAGIAADYPWLGIGDSLKHQPKGQANARLRDPFNEGRVDQDTLYQLYKPWDFLIWEGRWSVMRKQQGHLHNNMIQWTVMYGFPAMLAGLAALGLLFAAAWRQSRRSPDPLVAGLGLGTAAMLLAWFVNGIFEFNLGAVQSMTVFWLMVGLFLASTRLNQAKEAL